MTIPRIHVKEVDIPNIYTPDWMTGVIEKEVIKQIKFMMPSSTGTVVK